MNKTKNIGKVYGNYEIVGKDLSRGDTYYFIKCLLCGELMEQSYAFYCKQHNLRLIEIPYWDFDKIDSEYLLNLIK